ncbi:MAG: outer membrane beta-barrel domain-containing protein [Bacteriovoracaceae bacterium]
MKKLFTLIVLMMTSLVYASESSVYDFSWLDADKEVYVLQNRKFRKDKKLYLSGLAGITTSGSFVDAMSYQGRVGYFFTEEFGVELLYSKNMSKKNETYKNVQASGVDTFYRKIEDYMGGMFLWAPFYAKINTFNKVVYFDWIFGVGGAKLTTEDNRNDILVNSPGDDPLTSSSQTAVMWGTGPRFYLTDHWSIRLDMTAFYYKADRQITNSRKESANFSNYDLTLGLNYTF